MKLERGKRAGWAAPPRAALLALLAAGLLGGPPAGPAAARSVRHDLGELWERGSEGGGAWAVVVRPLGGPDRGRTFEAQARARLVVASAAKLFTAYAAAALLPADTSFETAVALVGERRGSTLAGDVWLVGRGAPGLRSRPASDPREPDPGGVAALDSLARAVRAAGIQAVTGYVGVDNRFYAPGDSLGRGWQWDDLPWWFAALVTPLALDDNALEVHFDPQRDGRVVLTLPPLPPGWEVACHARLEPGPGATDLSVDWESPRRAVFHGRLSAAGGTHHEVIALPQPALYAADGFRAALERAGVRLRMTEVAAPGATRQELRLRHPALRDVFPPVLARSQNNQAEMLLRDLGAARGAGASAAAGLEVLRGALGALGLDERDVRLADGSGLSRLNLVTAEALARVLEAAWRRSAVGDSGMRALLAGLARPGERGSLVHRFTGAEWEGHAPGWLRAKTGSMEGVDALAGVVTDSEGRASVVVSVRNGFAETREQARAWEEQLVRRVAR